MHIGSRWISAGTMSSWAVLCWLVLPGLAFAAWLFWTDGRPSASRGTA
jgi:hypothetical protein